MSTTIGKPQAAVPPLRERTAAARVRRLQEHPGIIELAEVARTFAPHLLATPEFTWACNEVALRRGVPVVEYSDAAAAVRALIER